MLQEVVMTVELGRGPIRLEHRQIVRICKGAGQRLCVSEGTVWITETSEPNDVVLESGACYSLKHDGLALVTGLDASVVTVN
jgi:hypothetical protein